MVGELYLNFKKLHEKEKAEVTILIPDKQTQLCKALFVIAQNWKQPKCHDT